jgi:hypothetical protein
MFEMTKCIIEGHYYKVDLGQDFSKEKIPIEGTDPAVPNLVDIGLSIGATFYVKCVRCGDRRLINDKCYEGRKSGEYKL